MTRLCSTVGGNVTRYRPADPRYRCESRIAVERNYGPLFSAVSDLSLYVVQTYDADHRGMPLLCLGLACSRYSVERQYDAQE